jgi:hypothetical protein
MPTKNHEERRSARQGHGLNTLKRTISRLGRRTIDKRTTVGKQLSAWRSELLADLGGIEALSTQELALVEEAVKVKLMLDSVAGWMLSQPTLVDKRKRALVPVTRDYQGLVATLRALLGDLGLERRARESPALADYLKSKKDDREPPPRDDDAP